VIRKCESEWLSISIGIPNARCQHQISPGSQSYPQTELITNSKEKDDLISNFVYPIGNEEWGKDNKDSRTYIAK
jgi:hypothetical protein